MSMLGHTLLIILALHFDSFLPLNCDSTIETKEIWMKYDEELYAKALMPGRRLLGSSDFYSRNDGLFFFYLILVIAVIIVILYKCCIKLAEQEGDSTLSSPQLHSTHRTSENSSNIRRTVRLPSGSRPLAPPRTSSSLILLPDETCCRAIIIGLPNVPFNSSSSGGQERRSSNPTPLLDLPPPYEDVIKGESDTCKINIPKDTKKDFLPK